MPTAKKRRSSRSAAVSPLSFDPKAPSALDMSGITFPARHSFGQSIGYWGRILEMLYTREFVAQMRPARASAAVWRVLAWLVELETVTIGQLVAHTQIERTVLSRLLDRMARQKLITRVESVDDRRSVMLRITAKGRAAHDRMRPIRENIYARATRGIDQRYIDFAREVIIKMVDNLDGRATLFPEETPRKPGKRSTRR
jgi:DNA-binding MarR family transcriptional regulator